MTVKRIVANIGAKDLSLAKQFYHDIFGLNIVMDQGWINTYASAQSQPCQLSIASQGGSDTPLPDLSIEVDNIDEIYKHIQNAGMNIPYKLVEEPWGVRRFYVIDPFGKLINVLEHLSD